MNNNTRTLFGFLLSSLITTTASAALYDRGNGMIYDSTQNITWLQDFNYAATSGYDLAEPSIHVPPSQCGNPMTGFYTCGGYDIAAGRMTYSDAKTWADNLIFNGYDDWRLPTAILSSDYGNCYQPFGCAAYYNGSINASYNNTNSELGHLFFVDLQNKAYYSATGQIQNDYGLKNTSFIDQQSGTTKSFFNIQTGDYLEYAGDYFYFNTQVGYHTRSGGDGKTAYAVAVRNGDVIPSVPVPAAAWLMGSGLIGLAAIKRRKK